MSVIYSTNEFNIYQDKRKSAIFTIASSNNNSSLNSSETFNILFNSITKTKLIDNSTKLRNVLFEPPNLEDDLNDKESFFSAFEIQKDIKQDNHNKHTENIAIIFKALRVESFTQFKERHYKINNSKILPYNLILNIIYSLSKQISYLLNNESKCFYKLDISKILVIDDCKFIYLSYEDLKDVKENKIYIYSPISTNSDYLSPELNFAKSIPILVNYKTIFYSLGLLILHICNLETPSCSPVSSCKSLYPRRFKMGRSCGASFEFVTGNLVEESNGVPFEFFNGVKRIKDTKLYYFLERCLLDEPEKRFLIYI
jgi:hypothetical protein